MLLLLIQHAGYPRGASNRTSVRLATAHIWSRGTGAETK